MPATKTYSSPPDVLRSKIPIGYLSHEVAKLMKRRFEEEAREHDMTLPQFRILAEVWRTPGATQAALASAIDSDPMTVSGILERLDKRGLVERFTNPDDSRAKLARITPEGQKLVDEVRTTGLVIYEEAMRGVSKAEQKVLTEALQCMRDNLNTMNARLKEDA
jgi:DNA-binding MarR family transcriptional regulator